MKVLIYGMSEAHGGVESFIYNYVKHFSHEIKVDFVSDYATIPFQFEFRMSGSKVFHLPSRRRQYFSYKRELKEIFKNNKYDIVWANVCSLSSIEVLLAAKRYGVPVKIVHSHNSQMMSGRLTNLLHKVNQKRIKNVATDFWACSKESGEWMFGSANINKPIHTVNNAIDVDKYIFDSQLRETMRLELGISEEFVVGHVGRFHHQKNHYFLFDTFKEIIAEQPKAKLVLVGSGSMEQSYREYSKKLGISKDILWLGQRNDVSSLMQAFDVFVLPSRFEGLPFVLVEAQASGLPSFTSLENVSLSSKITNLLEFISLKKTPKEWATQILGKRKDYRENKKKEISKAGYDIKTESQKLQKTFIKLRKNHDKK